MSSQQGTRALKYVRGSFGGFYSSEALPRALPLRQNSPQQPPYGLYPEQINGNAFTEPRSRNRYSWFYRIRPSVAQVSPTDAYKTWDHPTWKNTPFKHACSPEQYRFHPLPTAPAGNDFIDGFVTIAANGSPVGHDGCSANTYAATSSMSDSGRYVQNADADMLIMPSQGEIEVRTECGKMHVEPLELALIPRGSVFQVNLLPGTEEARGYCLENFGDHFVIPNLGPIGISAGLAHPRHFVAPSACYEDEKGEFELINKFLGNLFKSTINHSPFDVVAWYGSHVPLKYDMRDFLAINTVTYDHPDPSINCVISSYTSTKGLANCDFVIFPPRWVVAEDTFRPPWFHRNTMSEFMGLIHGSYDAKPKSFRVGASSIHNRFTPHGPDAAAVNKGSSEDTTKPERYSNTLAFMWETRLAWQPTSYALSNLKDTEYTQTWEGVQSRFDPSNVPDKVEAYPFPPSR